MTDNIGLNSFRKKKTERPENIIPELSEDTNRTMPEDLSTPSKSAKQIEKEKNKQLKANDKKRLKQ